jgi:hypothetical protein
MTIVAKPTDFIATTLRTYFEDYLNVVKVALRKHLDRLLADGSSLMICFRILAMLCFGITLASAQPQIEGLPIKFGDTYEKVREVYQTDLRPESTQSAVRGATALRLKTKGVWFFFNREGKIYTIRLDAPFAGHIGGVKIGDSATTMMGTLGKPAKIPSTLSNFSPRSYIYYLDDVTTVSFRTNSDEEIETIFLIK